MAGKLLQMSKLKQVLQLHVTGASNRSIASKVGLYKETVNKYIRQYKTLSIDLQELLQKDSPELEQIFSGGSPAYVDKRFADFSKRLPYLEKELARKHVTDHTEYLRDCLFIHKYLITYTRRTKYLSLL